MKKLQLSVDAARGAIRRQRLNQELRAAGIALILCCGSLVFAQSGRVVTPTPGGYRATSNTTLLIGTGAKVFQTQLGLAYFPGDQIAAFSNANPSNFMQGVVTSYIGRTFKVTITVIGGSGTYSDWNLSLTGSQGLSGAPPAPPYVGTWNSGTDVICALHGDTIAGLTCNNQVVDGTTTTSFVTTVTIPAGTITAGVRVLFNLGFGEFGTVPQPVATLSIKLGSVVVFQGNAASVALLGSAREAKCDINALAVASTTTPLVVTCAAQSFSGIVFLSNTLVTPTNKSIAVDTTIAQVLSVTISFATASSGNAIWLYYIFP